MACHSSLIPYIVMSNQFNCSNHNNQLSPDWDMTWPMIFISLGPLTCVAVVCLFLDLMKQVAQYTAQTCKHVLSGVHLIPW